jgi:toxin ParE1/3/4
VRVVFTSAAERSLEAIADYIAADNPARAISFVEELRTKSLGLAAHPKAFPLVPRYEKLGIRRRGYGRYLIFYRVETDRILILYVAHGAQEYDRLLLPDD